jgi:hypothetical protein
MITALNRNWHPEHFLCKLCERRVGEDGYHEKDGYAYCRYVLIQYFILNSNLIFVFLENVI